MKNSKEKVLKVLERAKERIQNESNWVQVTLYDRDNNQFCLLGSLLPERSIKKLKNDKEYDPDLLYRTFRNCNSPSCDAVNLIAKELGGQGYELVYVFNDNTSHEEVIEVLDKTINNLKEQIEQKHNK